MTTDNEIADVLVKAGVLECDQVGHTFVYYLPLDVATWTAAEALSDWRTAGQCLERMDTIQLARIHTDDSVYAFQSPRAICEAFARSWLKQNAPP